VRSLRLRAGVIVLVMVAACGPSRHDTSVPSTPAPSSTTTTSTTTSTTTTTVPTTTTTIAVTALAEGASGPEVVALQTRLEALGYWLDSADGTYGMTTMHAVTAFQKRSGLVPDGVAGALTMDALANATRPTAHSAEGHVIEIDLAAQTLLVVDDGVVQWVLDVSTGARAGTTPRGEWTVYRQVDGYDRGPLGTLYRPKYFHEGVAVHGFPSVPAHPASHGCVRVINPAMDWIWANDVMPRGTTVLVY